MNIDEMQFNNMILDLRNVNFDKLTNEELVKLDKALVIALDRSAKEFDKRKISYYEKEE